MSLCHVSLPLPSRESSGFANVESPAPAPAPLALRETLRLNKLWRKTLADLATRRADLALQRYLACKGSFAESEALRAKWDRLFQASQRANVRWFKAWDEYLGALK